MTHTTRTARHITIAPFVDTPAGKHVATTHLAVLRAIAAASLCLFGLAAVSALADTDRRIEVAARV